MPSLSVSLLFISHCIIYCKNFTVFFPIMLILAVQKCFTVYDVMTTGKEKEQMKCIADCC